MSSLVFFSGFLSVVKLDSCFRQPWAIRPSAQALLGPPRAAASGALRPRAAKRPVAVGRSVAWSEGAVEEDCEDDTCALRLVQRQDSDAPGSESFQRHGSPQTECPRMGG